MQVGKVSFIYDEDVVNRADILIFKAGRNVRLADQPDVDAPVIQKLQCVDRGMTVDDNLDMWIFRDKGLQFV